ncbi:MAG: CehA/McbA family metallohydrolase [Firmicutes bacterium]|nr:CehA/McbA family metallohydrolase [Bacillota bacterium]
MGRLVFELPPGMDWLRVRAHFAGADLPNLYAVDSEGATRLQWWGLRLGEPLIVPARLDEGASLWPGAVPGSLPAGGWHLLLADVARHGEGPRYRVEVTAGTGAPPDEPQTDARPVAWLSGAARPGEPAYDRYGWEHAAAAGARWYRGDLHLHTLLSDSRLSADLLSRLALERGLDFAVITEHNTLTTAWVPTSLMVIPGVELTSTRGHVNVLGVRSFPPLWYGEAPTLESEAAIDRLLAAYAAEGAVCSVNHPLLKPWRWEWEGLSLARVQAIEVLNDPSYPANAAATRGALALWDEMWRFGYRVWGVGGSDVHLLPEERRAPDEPPQVVGDPTTCVWAEALTPAGMVEGIRRGRVYVTRGPALAPEAVVGGERRLPGEDLAPDGGPVELEYSLRVEEGPGEGWVRWVENGEEVALEPLSARGRHSLRRRWPAGVYRWLRVEVLDGRGGLVAFVNPVYAHAPSPPPERRWGEAAVRARHGAGEERA